MSQPTGHDHTTGTLYRLTEECGNVIAAAQFGNLRFERGHTCRDERLPVAPERVAIRIGRRKVVLRRQRHVEAAMKRRDRRQTRADRRRTVVAAFKRDEMLLLWAARHIAIVRDEAQRCVDGI